MIEKAHPETYLLQTESSLKETISSKRTSPEKFILTIAEPKIIPIFSKSHKFSLLG